MYKATVNISGLKDLDRVLDTEFRTASNKIKDIAEDTKKIMQSYIKPRRRGSTGRLRESITVKKAYTGAGTIYYDVGRTKDMPIYWEVVNNGGYVPPPNKGYFGSNTKPAAGKSGERWTHVNNNKKYFIVPKKSIKPMRFIEKTISRVNVLLRKGYYKAF